MKIRLSVELVKGDPRMGRSSQAQLFTREVEWDESPRKGERVYLTSEDDGWSEEVLEVWRKPDGSVDVELGTGPTLPQVYDSQGENLDLALTCAGWKRGP